MRDVQLRAATEEDRELAFEIKERAFRPYLEAAGRWDEAKEREGHARRFSSQEFSLVVHEGEDVGVVALTRSGDGLTLHQLMILPEFQSQGYGGRALEVLLARAQEDRTPMRLRVMKTNPRARAFYDRFGFVTESETETHTYLIWRSA